MKLLHAMLLLSIFTTGLYSASFAERMGQGSLILYAPSFEYFQEHSSSLMQRFYGPNYLQMIGEIRLQSKQRYGVDIYAREELSGIGIAPDKPLAFIHTGRESGYLMLSISDEKKFSAFLSNQYPRGLYSVVDKGVAWLSARPEALSSRTNLLSGQPALSQALNRTAYRWDRFMVWLDSRYLEEVSSARGVTEHLPAAPGGTLIILDLVDKGLDIRAYTLSLRSESLKYMRALGNSGGKGKFDLLDFGWGNPAILLHTRLNLLGLYRYITDLDHLQILGFSPVVKRWKDEYQVDVEGDFLANTDGRVKLVVRQFDPQNRKYDLYGSVGIKSRAQAQAFQESLKQAILKSGARLFSFEIFTNPIYRYQWGGLDLYFGLIEQDFFIATDKESLVQAVKNIFEDKSGYLDSLPPALGDYSRGNKEGIFLYIDVPGLLGEVRPAGIKFNQDLMTGMQDIQVEMLPDQGDLPYGWTTRLKIRFFE